MEDSSAIDAASCESSADPEPLSASSIKEDSGSSECSSTGGADSAESIAPATGEAAVMRTPEATSAR